MKTKNWAIALFSATIAVALSTSTVLAEVIEVTANKLLLRSGPGPTYTPVFTFNKGDRLSKNKQQGLWTHIAFGQYEGWVFTAFTKTVAPGPGPGPGTGTGGGSGGGNIGTGPAPSRYESGKGNINNARYSGSGTATVQIVGTNRVVVTAIESINARPFSVTYYGEITSRNNVQIVANVYQFASTPTGNRPIPKSGNCQIAVSPDSNALRSFTCLAYSGIDHGKTIFTGI